MDSNSRLRELLCSLASSQRSIPARMTWLYRSQAAASVTRISPSLAAMSRLVMRFPSFWDTKSPVGSSLQARMQVPGSGDP